MKIIRERVLFQEIQTIYICNIKEHGSEVYMLNIQPKSSGVLILRSISEHPRTEVVYVIVKARRGVLYVN